MFLGPLTVNGTVTRTKKKKGGSCLGQPPQCSCCVLGTSQEYSFDAIICLLCCCHYCCCLVGQANLSKTPHDVLTSHNCHKWQRQRSKPGAASPSEGRMPTLSVWRDEERIRLVGKSWIAEWFLFLPSRSSAVYYYYVILLQWCVTLSCVEPNTADSDWQLQHSSREISPV